MSSNEIEVRHAAVSRAMVPLPLQQLGVVIAVEEETGREMVIIPPQVRQQLNVLDPVQSFAQARPDWSPAIRVVQLDPSKDGPHYYQQAGGKLAPTKQALELLAKAANVLYTRTRRMPKAELAEGERLGYIATLGIRASDGTVEELERSKTFVEEAELEEIKDSVTRAGKFGPVDDSKWVAEVRKRWLAELKNASAKTESKAVLRAIRAALQIPHTFDPGRAALPFVVVGFNFTPDQSDPEVRRILTQAGVNAAAALYGSETVPSSRSTLELEAGTSTPASSETLPADTQDDPAPTVGATDTDGRASGVEEGDEQAPDSTEGDDPLAAVGGSSVPAEEPKVPRFTPPDAAIDEAGATVVPKGDPKGLTIDKVAETLEGQQWLAYALRLTASEWPASFRGALELYVEHRLPDVWAAFEAEREAA